MLYKVLHLKSINNSEYNVNFFPSLYACSIRVSVCSSISIPVCWILHIHAPNRRLVGPVVTATLSSTFVFGWLDYCNAVIAVCLNPPLRYCDVHTASEMKVALNPVNTWLMHSEIAIDYACPLLPDRFTVDSTCSCRVQSRIADVVISTAVTTLVRWTTEWITSTCRVKWENSDTTVVDTGWTTVDMSSPYWTSN